MGVNRLYQSRTTAGPGPGAPHTGQALPGAPHTGTGPACFQRHFWEGGRAETGRAYLSGMGLWFWGLEEGVWKLSHPHGHRRGHDGVLGVHDGVEKRLQVGLRVAPYVDNLVSGRWVVLAWIHCPECKTFRGVKGGKVRSSKVAPPSFRKKKKSSIPKLFIPFTPNAG